MANQDLIDLTGRLALDPDAVSPDVQVWRLLCAQTLVEVDGALAGVRADDLADALSRDGDYRHLDPMAAAYLWLARSDGRPPVVDGR